MVAKKKDVVEETRPVLEVEEVERPLGTKTAWDVGPEVNQIIETVQNMKAVKMRFRNPKEIARIQMAIRHAVEKVDLVLRTRKAGDDRMIFWAEKVKETK